MRFNQSIPVVSYKIDARYSLKTGDMLHGSYALHSIPAADPYKMDARDFLYTGYTLYICYAAAMRCNQPIPADDPYRIDARDSLNTGDMLRSNCALQSINPCCFIQKGCAGLPKDKM